MKLQFANKHMDHRYKVIIQKEAEGGYSVFVPALPGCASMGKTVDDATANIREAIDLYLEDLNADNQAIPADNIQIVEVEAP